MSADESRISLKSAGFYEQIYFFGPPARRSAFMCCAVFSFIPAEKTELYLHTYGNLGIIFLYYSAVWCDV